MGLGVIKNKATESILFSVIEYGDFGDLVFSCMNEKNVGKMKDLNSLEFRYVSGIKGFFTWRVILNAKLIFELLALEDYRIYELKSRRRFICKEEEILGMRTGAYIK